MSGNAVRTKAVNETISYKLPEPFDYVLYPTGSLYATNVFNRAVMKERLPQDVFQVLAAHH